MTSVSTGKEGLRERKKRETLQRIAQAALKLFIENGYESTTLDEIAAEAGIARRTFFYYFKSKEAILLAFIDGGYAKVIGPTLLTQPTDQTPLHAVRNSFLEVASSHETDVAIVVDRLLQSTDALKARMQAAYVLMEHSIFEALCQMWPDPQRRASLRMVSIASMGAMRLAKESWREESGRSPLAKHIRESFAALETIV